MPPAEIEREQTRGQTGGKTLAGSHCRPIQGYKAMRQFNLNLYNDATPGTPWGCPNTVNACKICKPCRHSPLTTRPVFPLNGGRRGRGQARDECQMISGGPVCVRYCEVFRGESRAPRQG